MRSNIQVSNGFENILHLEYSNYKLKIADEADLFTKACYSSPGGQIVFPANSGRIDFHEEALRICTPSYKLVFY